MMDDQTALILALQLVALCCIAAALLMYLLCRIRNRRANNDDQGSGDCGLDVGLGRAVLITSCDTVLGLQCALHLSWLGFRVFAGFKNVGEGDAGNGTLAVKILKAKLKERETLIGENDGSLVANMGSVVPIPLDVTREDMLHEAVGLIRRHLPAGEDAVEPNTTCASANYATWTDSSASLKSILWDGGREGERRGVASQPTKVSFRANKNRWITETVDGSSYRTDCSGQFNARRRIGSQTPYPGQEHRYQHHLITSQIDKEECGACYL
uniref:Uncharacterized protein n=1 Tax=Timema shepardi TaxID=629360 RepID=A0A7R9G0M9_TIMSH|nr:unnamed protein product [Timema shepardi]